MYCVYSIVEILLVVSTLRSQLMSEPDPLLTAVIPSVSAAPAFKTKMLQVLPSYQKCLEEGTLLSIPYTTIFQYLCFLRELACLLHPLGQRAMVYLAAAASDFYIPHSRLVRRWKLPDCWWFSVVVFQSEHKIHSGGKLELDFEPTPKMIRPLVSEWAPKAFVVSFKVRALVAMKSGINF